MSNQSFKHVQSFFPSHPHHWTINRWCYNQLSLLDIRDTLRYYLKSGQTENCCGSVVKTGNCSPGNGCWKSTRWILSKLLQNKIFIWANNYLDIVQESYFVTTMQSKCLVLNPCAYKCAYMCTIYKFSFIAKFEGKKMLINLVHSIGYFGMIQKCLPQSHVNLRWSKNMSA